MRAVRVLICGGFRARRAAEGSTPALRSANATPMRRPSAASPGPDPNETRVTASKFNWSPGPPRPTAGESLQFTKSEGQKRYSVQSDVTGTCTCQREPSCSFSSSVRRFAPVAVRARKDSRLLPFNASFGSGMLAVAHRWNAALRTSTAGKPSGPGTSAIVAVFPGGVVGRQPEAGTRGICVSAAGYGKAVRVVQRPSAK